MTRKALQPSFVGLRQAVIGALMAALTCAPGAATEQTEDTLLVWTGDQPRKVPDFIAIIDFDRESLHYGKVLRTVPLPPPLKSNEAHHVGVSRDGRTVALGGLLSILSGQDQVFFFDVADRRHPTFIRSDNPPDASIAVIGRSCTSQIADCLRHSTNRTDYTNPAVFG